MISPCAVADRHLQRHLAGQTVRRTAETRIVGPKGHLDHVQQPLAGAAAPANERLGRLLDRHRNGGVVVRRPHDQVDLRQQAPLVGRVVVRERAPRGLDAAHALGRRRRRQHPVLLAGDLRIDATTRPSARPRRAARSGGPNGWPRCGGPACRPASRRTSRTRPGPAAWPCRRTRSSATAAWPCRRPSPRRRPAPSSRSSSDRGISGRSTARPARRCTAGNRWA